MTTKEIIAHRLFNQHIAETKFTKPEEIVSHFGAMQSQDWPMAKWAIGLRLPGSKEGDIESSFNEGKILRTHVLRPTWHFVSPEDIKWILQLTAPRVHQLNKLYYNKFGLEPKVLKKCIDIIIKSLRDNNYKTREALNKEFGKAKLMADRLRLAYIIMYAELEGLICSGPRVGKQFTYALLDERAPDAITKQKDEALHHLAKRYFFARGPATIQDFTWWSGLTVKEAKEGIASLGSKYVHEIVKNKEFIFYQQPLKLLNKSNITFLIPDYDEYGISYKDRSTYNFPKGEEKLSHPDFFHAIAVDGYHGGNWKRTMKGNKPVIEISPFKSLTKTQLEAVDRAIKKYMKFFS